MGVVFGDKIEETYKRAWKKVLNPSKRNIYISSINIKNRKEYANKLKIAYENKAYFNNDYKKRW